MHLILLDNRYSYDRPSGDRLGSQQWEWLEDKMRNTESDLTLILAGVQILRDNNWGEEHFGWNSKQKLYGIIREVKKDNVVLLTGDVHWASPYFTPCSSLVGYNLFEMCSSGLTHTSDAFWPWMTWLDFYSDPIYGSESQLKQINWGDITVDV